MARIPQYTQKEWNEFIAEHKEILFSSLLTLVADTSIKYTDLVRQGDKDFLRNIYISFLRTSIVCRIPLYRVDLCDANGQADLHPLYAYWDVKVVSHRVYARSEHVPKGPRFIREYEIESIWYEEAERMNQAIADILFDNITINPPEGINLNEVLIHFGNYLGEQQRISFYK